MDQEIIPIIEDESNQNFRKSLRHVTAKENEIQKDAKGQDER